MRKNNFANIFRPFAQGSFVPFMVSADIALETGSRQDAGANSWLAWISLLGGGAACCVCNSAGCVLPPKKRSDPRAL
jgi:hypothetical protein